MCDGCPSSGPAIVPVTAPLFERWVRIQMESGAEAHLCPDCQEKKERGWLAEELVLECVRCKRNTVDNPELKRWHMLPGAPGERARHLCLDCFRPDENRWEL